MKTIDFSGIIVVYNLVIGILVMLSSEKLAAFAGYFNKLHRERIVRLARLSSFTLGAIVAVLSASIYVAFHILRIGV